MAAQSAAVSYAKSEAKLGNSEYVSLCQANGFTYVPLVVDTYGAWDPSTFHYFKSIAASHAITHNYSMNFSRQILMTNLSSTLQTQNALNLIEGRTANINS